MSEYHKQPVYIVDTLLHGTLKISAVCIAVFLILLVDGMWHPVSAQQDFGIHYHARTDAEDVYNDISVIRDMEVRTLMLNYNFPEDQLQIINEFDFEYIAHTGYEYPTVHRLLKNANALDHALDEIRTKFNEDRPFELLSLFRHGAIKDEQFRNLFSNITDDITAIDEPELTYISPYHPPEVFSDIIDSYILEIHSSAMLEEFDDFDSLDAIYYRPSNDRFDLRDFQNAMDILEQEDILFLIDWEWFVYNVTDDPLLAEVIQEYATNPDAVFPNPAEEEERMQGNTLILILLLLWGSFIIHYVFVPPYQKSLNRYFHSHNFFVGDIIYRRLRIGFPNVIVLLQQAILAGIFVNALLFHYLSDLGREALTNNLVFLESLPGPAVTFTIVMGAVFFINCLFIVWIYLVHRHLQSISQIAVILLWPQHLNLVIISALIALLAAGITGMVITILIILYLVVLFGSYLLAAIDASRFIYIRFYYYPLTIGLYIAALVLLYIYVLSGNGYVNAWELASTMP